MLQKYKEVQQSNSIEPIRVKEDDRVTSDDQSEARTKTDSSNNANEFQETGGKDKNDTKETDLEEEEYRELKVLYDILAAFLLDYCNIAFTVSWHFK